MPHSITIKSNSNSISGSTILKLINETNTTSYDFSFDEQENLAIAETNVGTRFFIQKGGNIGIGTLNPQALFDVNGNAKILGSLEMGQSIGEILHFGSQVLDIKSENSSEGVRISGQGGTVHASLRMSDNSRSTLTVGHPASQVVAIGGNTDHIFQLGGFANDLTSFTPKMTFSTNGNVGIGTTAPVGNLEIQNVNNTTDNNYLLALHNKSNTDGSSALISFSGSAAEPGIGGFNPAVFGYVRGGGFVWKETGGSGEPPTTMSLRNGNLNVTGSVTATQFIGDGSLLTGINGGSSLWAENGGNVYLGSGNVGVGVSDPLQALHVNGSVRADNGEFQSWGAIVLHPDVDESGDDIIRFVNSEGQTNMEIDGNGKVGIGTAPNAVIGLTVKDNITIKGGGLYLDYSNNTTAGYMVPVGGDIWLTAFQTGAGMALRTSNTNRVFINGDGNVGIGTTSIPGAYKLAVDGRIICENVRVQNSTAWPDFVFEKNYELPSLQEVEQFINKEKHLPNMPSAGEVEAEGIDVSLMQNKLLQKVEELTLYTIRQQKQIEAQQEQIAALSNMLKTAIQQIEKQ